MGFSRQEYWIGLPFSSPGDVPHPGIKPASPASAGRFSTTEPTGKSYSLKLTQKKKKNFKPNNWRLFASSCPPNAQRFWDVLFFFLNTFLFYTNHVFSLLKMNPSLHRYLANPHLWTAPLQSTSAVSRSLMDITMSMLPTLNSPFQNQLQSLLASLPPNAPLSYPPTSLKNQVLWYLNSSTLSQNHITVWLRSFLYTPASFRRRQWHPIPVYSCLENPTRSLVSCSP